MHGGYTQSGQEHFLDPDGPQYPGETKRYEEKENRKRDEEYGGGSIVLLFVIAAIMLLLSVVTGDFTRLSR